jgi:oligopeptide/dipeptide ABC transporter ATP-binding protein
VLLEVRQLKVAFPAAGGSSLTAVRDVAFSIRESESLALVGESGSGKSATALALMRLLPPQARVEGEIHFAGRNLLSLPEEEVRKLRGRKMAMIFQEPMTALNPVMRVGDQIAEAVLAHEKVSKNEAMQRAIAAMTDVALREPDRLARDYPHQLSGGMRQRVMIAMALVNRPQLLIADEPTTALDVTVQQQILDLLADLRARFSLAMLFISHDLAVVSKVADRIAVMYAGSIVESGTTEHIFRQAVHPYTRGLLRAVPTLRSDRTKPLLTINGTVPAITSLPPGCGFEPRCDVRVPQCREALPELVEIAPGHTARCPVNAARG